MNSESFKAARARLSPWDDNLPAKFVEFEIRRKFKSFRRCMHVPKLCRIDELVPTTNFMSELGNFAEFMYSVGKCVISRDDSRAPVVAASDPLKTVDSTSSLISEDEGVSDLITITSAPLAATTSTASSSTGGESSSLKLPDSGAAVLRLRRKRTLSSSGDGFLADEEDNDDDDESSGFYSDASECTAVSEPVVERVRPFRNRNGLYLHSQLPLWLRNNEFIVGGHRPPAYSYRKCLKSVFQLHSETGNIWSHGLGALGWIVFVCYFYFGNLIPGLSVYDRLVFGVFFLASIGCLGMSSIYHTLACHSNKVCTVACKLDFTGITILIFGSFVPWLYFTFYNHPNLRLLYGITGTVSALATIKMSLSDEFGQAHYRGLRSTIYIAYAMICGVLPVVHFCVMYGLQELVDQYFLLRFAAMVSSYVIGALFYSVRVPEKYWPGRFDYALHSHQIMHLCVVLGNVAHYWGCHGLAEKHVQRAPLLDDSNTLSDIFDRGTVLLQAWFSQAVY